MNGFKFELRKDPIWGPGQHGGVLIGRIHWQQIDRWPVIVEIAKAVMTQNVLPRPSSLSKSTSPAKQLSQVLGRSKAPVRCPRRFAGQSFTVKHFAGSGGTSEDTSWSSVGDSHTGVADSQAGTGRWPGQRCTFTVIMPPSGVNLMALLKASCSGSARALLKSW